MATEVRRMIRPAGTKQAMVEDDPVVTRDIVMDEFRRLHEGVIKFELRDFDYGWLRENQLDLYATIKAKEAEFETTEGKPLSVLLGLIREWVELVREGYRLQTRPEPESDKKKTSDLFGE